MPCALAILPNSPIFSPSSKIPAIFYKSPATSSPRVVHGRFQRFATPLSSDGAKRDRSSEMGIGSCSSAALKRKRPARIDIPMAAMSFAAVRSPISGGERIEVVEAEEEGYSVYCKRGKRGVMEDRYSAFVDLQSESRQAFFGVFDGHGGSKAAEFAAKNLDANIAVGFENGSEEEIASAVKSGYLKTDSDFLEQDSNGGTCCVTALIRNQTLVVSNAGDCRAVMSRAGATEVLTADHRPSRPEEKERVESLGGYVDCRNGIWRIQGTLAVSRGIGDRSLKQWVIAEPETKIFKIERDCEFLILASDGLWDKVDNQEAVDTVRPLLVGADKPELVSACKKLVEMSVRRGSTDDISVVIVQLSHFMP